jgi:hypothetical protein
LSFVASVCPCSSSGASERTPAQPTTRKTAHPTRKAPTPATMRRARRTTAHPTLFACVACYKYHRACHTRVPSASRTQANLPNLAEGSCLKSPISEPNASPSSASWLRRQTPRSSRLAVRNPCSSFGSAPTRKRSARPPTAEADAYLRAVGEYGAEDVNTALDNTPEQQVFEIGAWLLGEHLRDSGHMYVMVTAA